MDGEYTLHGHKWFTSAPMNDVFLVLAQAAGRPHLLRGAAGAAGRHAATRSTSYASRTSSATAPTPPSELELDGTLARRLGDEGRGVRTIIEMVAATRLDCVLGSTVADAPRAQRGDLARRPPLGVRRRCSPTSR